MRNTKYEIRNTNNGYAMVVTLMVIVVLVIIAFSVTSLNQSSLFITRSGQFKAMALESARAGISDAIYWLYDDPNWNTGFNNKALPNNLGSYTITFNSASGSPYSTNNASGSASVIGYQGRTIPAGFVHLVSVGSYKNRAKTAETLLQVGASSFFQNVLLAQNNIIINQGFTSDSFDSSQGTYGATKQNSNGNLGSNGTSSGIVSLTGTPSDPTIINGDITVGVGADPNSAITTSGDVTINGNKLAATEAMQFPQITATSNDDHKSYGNGNFNLDPGTYGNLTINKGTLTLTGTPPGTPYIFKNITILGSGALKINSSISSPVVVYVDGTSFNMSDGSIQNKTKKSNYLVFYGTDTITTVNLIGGNEAYFAFYARQADMTLAATNDYYGAWAGKTITAANKVNVHFDKVLCNVQVPGFISSAQLTIKSRW